MEFNQILLFGYHSKQKALIISSLFNSSHSIKLYFYFYIFNSKNYQEALKFINNSIQNNPEELTNFILKANILILYNKFSQLKATQHYEDALMSLDDAIQINPSSSDAYHQKCLTLLKKQNQFYFSFDGAVRRST